MSNHALSESLPYEAGITPRRGNSLDKGMLPRIPEGAKRNFSHLWVSLPSQLPPELPAVQ